MDSIKFEVTWANYATKHELKKKKKLSHNITIARGNWRSMNKEIAGKIISDVRGFEETKAAVASELKATSNGMPVHSAMLHAWTKRNNQHGNIRSCRQIP